MSASPTLSIAQCLIARVNKNAMNLPIKLLSKKQKEIEIVEEGFFGLWCWWKVYRPELYQNERNQDGGPQRTNLGL